MRSLSKLAKATVIGLLWLGFGCYFYWWTQTDWWDEWIVALVEHQLFAGEIIGVGLTLGIFLLAPAIILLELSVFILRKSKQKR